MTQSKRKKAKAKYSPNPTKKVTTTYNPDNWYQQPVRWSFCKMDPDHERWGVLIDSRSLSNILRGLMDFERMGTWNAILTDTSGRKRNTRNHEILKTRMIREAQLRLAHLNLMEDSLYSFSQGNKPRLWGIREGNVFCLVWIDQDHEICPSMMKNT